MSGVQDLENKGSWVHQELGEGVDFHDRRLNQRFEKIAESFSRHPSHPINQATEDWAATKAAYRFFDNPKVTAETILSRHFENTIERVNAQERVVIVQDSSGFDFTRHHRTRGLGMTSKPKDGVEMRGILVHSTLAMTTSGLPLGLLDHQLWIREEDRETKQTLGSHQHYMLPIEEKESFRWVKALRTARDQVRDAQVIMVADREADIYELFAEAEEYGIDLVIRQKHDRMLIDEDLGYLRVTELLSHQRATAQVEVEVKSNGKRKARKAVLDIKHMPVQVTSNGRGINNQKIKDRRDLDLYVVDLKENHPPKGETPLHWTLFTTFVVQTDEDAFEVARFYRMRWTIEDYFKCLKTGCKVEDTRLMDAEKIIRYASLLSVLAWRILWMTLINRTDGDASCEAVLTSHEWQALWLMKNKRRIKLKEISPEPPSEPPTIREAMRWLASLGGFLERKGDKDPGLVTIWRGWLALMPSVEMYELLLPHLKK